jgi:hypothetical protein
LDPHHLSGGHVKEFLITYLADEKKVSASTQNLAFNSLLFFFRHVLNKEFGQMEGVVRAKKRHYQVLHTEIKDHLRAAKLLHSKDLEKGYGGAFWPRQLKGNISMQAVTLSGNGCFLPSS